MRLFDRGGRARLLFAAVLAVLVAVAVCVFPNAVLGQLPDNIPDGEFMTRLFALPTLTFFSALTILTACARPIVRTITPSPTASVIATAHETTPKLAQVVGLQWLNPLHRRDYPTEWQLLWTLGLVFPNNDDDMVLAKPKKYSKVQPMGAIADGSGGAVSFKGYHEQYIDNLTIKFRDIYFSSSSYFYNAHSLVDRKTWRELAGIHIEYACPTHKLDAKEVETYVRDRMIETFEIGNIHFPKAWSRSTPPDVHVTMGGPNAGFTSLSAALDYLQAHPDETVWAMNWDAPSYPPSDEQINENMVLLVMAGPNYKTEREPLAWIGYPATHNTTDFEKKSDLPPRIVQAWNATLHKAVENAGKDAIDIGYVIHDANNTHADSSDRLGNLAHVLTTQVAEFDFAQRTFNTPALLGEMGAGTALTNVALGIAYANHLGKNVLVAGTHDLAKPTAVLVVPPAKVRPIDLDKPWFRARGENNAYLMWWGLRHDAGAGSQGYSK